MFGEDVCIFAVLKFVGYDDRELGRRVLKYLKEGSQYMHYFNLDIW